MEVVLGEEGELPLTERVLLALPSEKGEGMNEERIGRLESAISVGLRSVCPADFSKTIYSFVVCNPG